MSIAAVINFCTNEARFLPACIAECRVFAEVIVISFCDHFFDGEPENRPALEELIASFPDCLFLEFPFIPDRIQPRPNGHFWHSAARFLAVHFLPKNTEFVLFLDADEIPDGPRFLNWVQKEPIEQSALKFTNYWYFREPIYQALEWEDSAVLARKALLTRSILLHQEERNAIYDLLPFPKKRGVVGLDQLPLIHHYSWVRSEEEIKKKVRSWGHSDDRDWEREVEREWSAPFSGKDFIHGYSYREVSSQLDLSLQRLFCQKEAFEKRALRPNWKRVSILEAEHLLCPNMWKKIIYKMTPHFLQKRGSNE